MNYRVTIRNPFKAQEKLAEAAAPFVKNIRRGHRWRQVAAALLICCIASVAFLHFVVGWSHMSEHISSVKALFINGNETIRTVGLEVAAGTGAGLPPDTERVADVPIVLLDTAMWGAAIRNGDFIPDGVREEYEQAKKFDYSRLVPAGKRPTNEEAQAAIIASYGDEISRLLEQYKASIRLGRAYAAPLQNNDAGGAELVRITAMICAFNNKGDNLGNIQRPLDIAYDFVQYASDPGNWHAEEISQTLPYDYALNKDK